MGKLVVKMKGEELLAALDAVLMFVGTGGTRPYSYGDLWVEITGPHVDVVATDGHTLAVYQGERTPGPGAHEGAFCIRARDAKQLLQMLKGAAKGSRRAPWFATITVPDGDGPIDVALSTGARYSLPRSSDQFPPWRKVVPDHATRETGETPALAPKYAARAAQAMMRVGASDMTAWTAGELEPVLVTSQTAPLVIVIMPMRVDADRVRALRPIPTGEDRR